MSERLCSKLRVAREALCVAQTDCRWSSHRQWLQEALDSIDRIGVFSCPTWSRYNDPEVGAP
jgi:hypothetical protein